MKRKRFLPIKKCAAFLMMIVMLLSTVTGIAYADELGEVPIPDGTYYLNGLVLLAGSYGTTGKDLTDEYTTCVYLNDGYKGRGRYAEMNNNAGGKYIFLGYTNTRSVYGEDGNLRSDLITDLLVYNGANPPTQLKYKGKTYNPITKLLGAADGDFNQGTGGSSLYLYYTNDGIENGDPILTWIRARSPKGKTHSEKYVKKYTADERSDTPDDCLCQDMNENAGGDFIYLEADYHTHTYVEKIDSTGHPYSECTACSFVKKNHIYKYTNLTGLPGYHEATCTYEGCTKSIVERHVDADEDGICDKCQAKGTVVVDGYLFGKFPDAWDYALGKDGPVTIYILETVSADANLALRYITKGEDITIERASTASDSSILKAHKEDSFVVKNGSLTIKTDVEAIKRSIKTVVAAVGPEAKVSIENSTINVTDSKEGAVISAQEGANVNVSNTKISIQNKDNQVTGIMVTGKDSSVTLSDVDIQGAGHAIKADQSENVTIENGKFNAKTCALLLTGGAKATAKGGKFIGAECINAADGNITIDNIKVRGKLSSPSTVAELLPKDYGAFILDASEERYEGISYRDLANADYMFDKLSEIGKCNGHAILKVQSISDKEHEGHCEYCNMAVVLPHEFGEGGTCIICGGGSEGGNPQNDNPQTGDNSTANIIWYMIIFVTAAAVISGMILYLRKKDNIN